MRNSSARTSAFVLSVVLLAGILSACGGSPEETDEVPERTFSDRLSFENVTEAAGLSGFRHETGAFGLIWFPESMGSGAAFFDYDGDGWQDIALAGGGRWSAAGGSAMSSEEVLPLRLYRNLGDGTFSEVTETVGLAGFDGARDVYGLGIAAADYDGDGDLDIYLSALAENLLFRNEGGVFVEVGREAGVAGEAVWSSSPIFFDADRDGDLDLYVGNYVAWSPETDIYCSLDGVNKGYCTPETYEGVAGRFYRNRGDGTFADETEAAGFLPAAGKTLGVAELDFNRDGWPDLMVANDTQPDYLYVNNGDGTFSERGALSGVAYDENGKARAGMGVDTGVVDSTGQASVFVGNFSSEMIGVYRHLHDGLFIDRAALSQIGRPSLMTLTFSLFLADFDLDTDLDLFAANGHVQPEIETVQDNVGYEEKPHLFLNRGDGTFEDAAPALGGVLAEEFVGRGAGAPAGPPAPRPAGGVVCKNGGGPRRARILDS
ncbi:MAG: VCBS repeat-containing protein, partial [Bacteroidetes bacterium SB0662_bin_6]|nr:VCBS repeat-containing protein [Bacteroidetes bacterium SB0662_bin_6]